MAGQSTYAFGNCTWWVAGAVAWVQGGWGDGGDWAYNAQRAGLQLTSVPTVGSVVCYARGNGYSVFGHVALVIAVYGPQSYRVREMNFYAFDTVDERDTSTYDVAAFILGPGMVPGGGGPGPGGQGAGAGTPGLDQVAAAWSLWQQWLNVRAPQQIVSIEQAALAVSAIR